MPLQPTARKHDTGTCTGGIIDSMMPVKYFYPVMLVIIPLIFFTNWIKFNAAVNDH